MSGSVRLSKAETRRKGLLEGRLEDESWFAIPVDVLGLGCSIMFLPVNVSAFVASSGLKEAHYRGLIDIRRERRNMVNGCD